MFGLLANFAHKAEMRESRDEMLLGEIVRVMFKEEITVESKNEKQLLDILRLRDNA